MNCCFENSWIETSAEAEQQWFVDFRFYSRWCSRAYGLLILLYYERQRKNVIDLFAIWRHFFSVLLFLLYSSHHRSLCYMNKTRIFCLTGRKLVRSFSRWQQEKIHQIRPNQCEQRWTEEASLTRTPRTLSSVSHPHIPRAPCCVLMCMCVPAPFLFLFFRSFSVLVVLSFLNQNECM